jgi:hypothetical protein
VQELHRDALFSQSNGLPQARGVPIAYLLGEHAALADDVARLRHAVQRR